MRSIVQISILLASLAFQSVAFGADFRAECEENLRQRGFRSVATFNIVCGRATRYTAPCVDYVADSVRLVQNDSLAFICGVATRETIPCIYKMRFQYDVRKAASLGMYCSRASRGSTACLESNFKRGGFVCDATMAKTCSPDGLGHFETVFLDFYGEADVGSKRCQ